MTSGPTSVAQDILEPVLPVWPRQSICQVCSWLCWQVLVWAMNWWESRHKGWKRRKNKGWDLNKPQHPSLYQDSQTVKLLVFSELCRPHVTQLCSLCSPCSLLFCRSLIPSLPRGPPFSFSNNNKLCSALELEFWPFHCLQPGTLPKSYPG